MSAGRRSLPAAIILAGLAAAAAAPAPELRPHEAALIAATGEPPIKRGRTKTGRTKKKAYRPQKREAGRGESSWWHGRARNRRRQERRKLERDYLEVTDRPLTGRQWKRLRRGEKRHQRELAQRRRAA